MAREGNAEPPQTSNLLLTLRPILKYTHGGMMTFFVPWCLRAFLSTVNLSRARTQTNHPDTVSSLYVARDTVDCVRGEPGRVAPVDVRNGLAGRDASAPGARPTVAALRRAADGVWCAGALRPRCIHRGLNGIESGRLFVGLRTGALDYCGSRPTLVTSVLESLSWIHMPNSVGALNHPPPEAWPKSS